MKDIYILPKARTRVGHKKTGIKTYHPSLFMQKVFSEVFDINELEEHERDEPRKIFISYFKKYYEVIKRHKLCPYMIVNIPGIGEIVPYPDPYLNQITRICTGEILKDRPPKAIPYKLMELLRISFELEKKFIEFYNSKQSDNAKRNQPGAIERRIKTHSKTWIRNLKKRRVNPVIFEYIARSDDSKGFLF